MKAYVMDYAQAFSPSNEYNVLLNYCMNDDSTRVITGTVNNVESCYDEMTARYDSMANAGVYDYADFCRTVPSFTVIAVDDLLSELVADDSNGCIGIIIRLGRDAGFKVISR